MFPFLETHSTRLFTQLAQLFQVTLDSLQHFFTWQWRMLMGKKKTTLRLYASTSNWRCHPNHEVPFLCFLLNLHVHASGICIASFLFYLHPCFQIFQESCVCSNKLRVYLCVGGCLVSSVHLGHFHSLHYCHAATLFTAGQVNF